MIEEISIRNLGVISDAKITFGSRMNALTGETGAGKTMALTSLLLLMGAKATATQVRHGEDTASITGIFSVPENSNILKIVEDAGGVVDYAGEEAEIIVSRQVLSSGRSRAYIGGVNVPVAALRKIASELFTVHGQQDQLRLSSKTEHLKALDDFANLREQKIFHDYLSKWQEWSEIKRKFASESENVAGIATERLALEALISRVENVSPYVGEDDELRAQANRLANVEILRSALAQSVQLLEGDEYQAGALNLIETACSELKQTHDTDYEKYAQTLHDSASIISDVLTDISRQLNSLDADPERLAEIHERRAEINTLIRELGMDLPTMLERAEEAKKRLQEIVDPDSYLQELANNLAIVEKELSAIAAKVSALRKKAAKHLSVAVTEELQRLAMKDAKFEINFTDLENLGKDGKDDVEFLLSPHPGAKLAKLTATASGGEISRIMLAIEVTLAKKVAHSQHTFIFDEVDAGIGGETALSVGRRLSELAQNAQVIVVTHLAQVAAAASTHLVVEKESSENQTKTQVRKLEKAEREIELARMLSGQADSEAARTHAAELISTISVATLNCGI